jgi:hypothetical protein
VIFTLIYKNKSLVRTINHPISKSINVEEEDCVREKRCKIEHVMQKDGHDVR